MVVVEVIVVIVSVSWSVNFFTCTSDFVYELCIKCVIFKSFLFIHGGKDKVFSFPSTCRYFLLEYFIAILSKHEKPTLQGKRALRIPNVDLKQIRTADSVF